MLNDPKYKGKIQNTGSSPANINADVDIVATSPEAARDLANDWAAKGKKKPVYYTTDAPSTPTNTPPDDFKKVIKVVDPNSDTTLWTPETDEIRRVKVQDHDAWTTSGGQKGTGNIGRSRDKRGYYLDNEKKFLHSDRPISDTPGVHDEDLKTFSKSVAKAGGDNGAKISANNPEFYEQAQKMQKYGDPVEAGIVDLGDSPEVRKQKLENWKQTARDEMKKAEKRSAELGDVADAARGDLAQQMRDQGHHDVADRIEEHRTSIAESNADAAAQNDRLRAERDDILGIKETKTNLADDVVDGSKKTTKGLADIDAPKKPKGSADIGVDADDLVSGSNKASKGLAPDVDVKSPESKRVNDADAAIDTLAAAETAAQVFQSATKAAGQAIDENRDLNASDVGEIVKDMTPGIREYEMSKAYITNRQVEALGRQEKIRQLESKENLTLDEELELIHLKNQEEQNPDTAFGHLSGAITDAGEHYQKRMEDRKKAQGREDEPDSFVKDGIPMAADMAVDGVNIVNPFNQIGTPIAEGIAEASTFDERQAWSSIVFSI